ncbi:MAG: FGGY-family carbohydrate kinase [Celeribacter marinus]
MAQCDIIIGIDAGTSVIKAVALDLSGRQIATSSALNTYRTGADGSAVQSLPRTWADCVKAIRGLFDRVDNLAVRTAAIAVTGQGDGTWLVGAQNAPVTDAWLWLDARAAPTARALSQGADERARFEATGTGLNTSQQSTQMAHMDRHVPELLDRAEVALHCKDWLFANLTGVRATDPSEASFTFGNFRTRDYDDTVLNALCLSHRKSLLPPIVDGSQTVFALTPDAAQATGLLAGTPVSLGYVDMVMTALGAGVHTGHAGSACSTIGSTGVHMRSVLSSDVHLNGEGAGYVICLPVANYVTQVQTNMAATLNIDWALRMAADMMTDLGYEQSYSDLVPRIDDWLARSDPGTLLYHPYISEAGERGPFVNANARASFVGLNANHRFADLLRGVVEGLALAARDCYGAMGEMPSEVRLTGGAARSGRLRAILSGCLNTPVRVSARDEAGAAGCAMMAAVAIGAYETMDECIATWVTPLLAQAERPDPALVATYDGLYAAYAKTRRALTPIWDDLAAHHAAMTVPPENDHTEMTTDARPASRGV